MFHLPIHPRRSCPLSPPCWCNASLVYWFVCFQGDWNPFAWMLLHIGWVWGVCLFWVPLRWHLFWRETCTRWLRRGVSDDWCCCTWAWWPGGCRFCVRGGCPSRWLVTAEVDQLLGDGGLGRVSCAHCIYVSQAPMTCLVGRSSCLGCSLSWGVVVWGGVVLWGEGGSWMWCLLRWMVWGCGLLQHEGTRRFVVFGVGICGAPIFWVFWKMGSLAFMKYIPFGF